MVYIYQLLFLALVCIMFVLKGILRAESQEKILLYLLIRERGYGKAIAEFYGKPQNPLQKQLIKLEDDGVLVSRMVGKTKEYQLNPRYAFYTPLKVLLKSALGAYPKELLEDLSMDRRRPRKSDKPSLLVRE